MLNACQIVGVEYLMKMQEIEGEKKQPTTTLLLQKIVIQFYCLILARTRQLVN